MISFLGKDAKEISFMYCIICYCTTEDGSTSFLSAISLLGTGAVHNGKFLYTDRRRLAELFHAEAMMPTANDPELFSFWVHGLFFSIHIYYICDIICYS